MNDTHGEKGEGWYGFDLDGTLAKYDGWKGIDHIGEPVKPMVELIRRMHDEGKPVKIMTARVAPKEKPEVKPNPYMNGGDTLAGSWCAEPDVAPWGLKYEWGPREFIQKWCHFNLGFIPEIVYQKDHLMLELYDDRVKQVVPNEGWLVEDIAASKRQCVVVDRVTEVNAKWYDRTGAFLLGMLFGVALVVGLVTTRHTQPLPEATENLHKAIHEFMESQRRETGDETVR